MDKQSFFYVHQTSTFTAIWKCFYCYKIIILIMFFFSLKCMNIFVVPQIVSGSNRRVPIGYLRLGSTMFPTSYVVLDQAQSRFNIQKFWIKTFESLFTSRIGVVYYLKADARCQYISLDTNQMKTRTVVGMTYNLHITMPFHT